MKELIQALVESDIIVITRKRESLLTKINDLLYAKYGMSRLAVAKRIKSANYSCIGERMACPVMCPFYTECINMEHGDGNPEDKFKAMINEALKVPR